MSVQLLDKTRKINRLLHNNSSSKVVFNDICDVLTDILDSNVLVVSKKGDERMPGEKNLVDSLRQLGKYTDLVPNYFLLAADRIEELEEEIVTPPPTKVVTPNVTEGGSTNVVADEVKTQTTSVGGNTTPSKIDDDDWDSDDGEEIVDDEGGKSGSRSLWDKVSSWLDNAFKPSADTIDEDDPL